MLISAGQTASEFIRSLAGFLGVVDAARLGNVDGAVIVFLVGVLFVVFCDFHSSNRP